MKMGITISGNRHLKNPPKISIIFHRVNTFLISSVTYPRRKDKKTSVPGPGFSPGPKRLENGPELCSPKLGLSSMEIPESIVFHTLFSFISKKEAPKNVFWIVDLPGTEHDFQYSTIV